MAKSSNSKKTSRPLRGSKPLARESRHKRHVLWVSLFKIGFVTFLLWAAVAGVYYLWALNLDLRRIHEMSERSVVYDYQGKYYSRLAGENREVVPFDKVSNHFVNASSVVRTRGFTVTTASIRSASPAPSCATSCLAASARAPAR